DQHSDQHEHADQHQHADEHAYRDEHSDQHADAHEHAHQHQHPHEHAHHHAHPHAHPDHRQPRAPHPHPHRPPHRNPHPHHPGDPCPGIPVSAKAVSVNVTVVTPGATGDLFLYATGTGLPESPAMPLVGGKTRANNDIVMLNGGQLTVRAVMPSGTTQFILDVN